jgi:hypothetical protein
MLSNAADQGKHQGNHCFEQTEHGTPTVVQVATVDPVVGQCMPWLCLGLHCAAIHHMHCHQLIKSQLTKSAFPLQPGDWWCYGSLCSC